jgi:Tol biopolymer transport system component
VWPALAAALVVGAAQAPPASRVVFASDRTGLSQLYSVTPSGRGLAQLTFDKTGWGSPIPSPDGRFVAAIRNGRLWVMRPDGRDRRPLARNAHGVSWSADSRRLALQVGLGVVTIARQGGEERWVSPGDYESWPSPSPHARAVAFLRNGKLVVHRKGRNRTLVPQASGAPAWSPDGRWIATVSGSGDAVELVRPTGGPPVVVARRVGGSAYGPTLAWSPDALVLAYADLDGIHILSAPSGDNARLLVAGPSGPLAWSPAGDAIAFVRGIGPALVTTDGAVRTLVAATGAVGAGWTVVRPGDRYRVPQLVRPGAALVEVSQRELRAHVPIGPISADGDRVAYWLCPHVLGAWRPGDAAQIPLGRSTVETCSLPSDPIAPGTHVYDLVLAGDRVAYLTTGGSNTHVWELWLTTFERRDEGLQILGGGRTAPEEGYFAIGDLVGGESTLVFGRRGLGVTDYGVPESIWRLDGAAPVQVARAPDDLRPLAADEGRIVAQRVDGSLELLDLEGGVLRTFDVPALGAVLADGDLVVLVQGQLRDYSTATGVLLHAWPLPDVPSAGACRLLRCPGIRLTLDAAATGVAVYTLDGVVHLLRLDDGEDKTVPGATAAALTGAGLFYSYLGDEPWPGRIRFVPFNELPLP